MAARTRAPTGSAVAVQRRCSGSEPALAPMRSGVPVSRARSDHLRTLSSPPMLPGLMRTAATPASMRPQRQRGVEVDVGDDRHAGVAHDGRQRVGVGDARHRDAHDLAAGLDAAAPIWASVASTSCVLVVVMDCTTTGAPPPIGHAADADLAGMPHRLVCILPGATVPAAPG